MDTPIVELANYAFYKMRPITSESGLVKVQISLMSIQYKVVMLALANVSNFL